MAKQSFVFREFVVLQDKCRMKISTDSVLIGAWTVPGKATRILDLGTGTGIIALMLAQRTSAKIDAIDIDKDACMQAQINFSASSWSDRLDVIHSSVQKFSPDKEYGIIVSNPPFFPCPKTHMNKEGAQARFTHKLSFEELASSVVRLLAPKGKFFIILPVHEGACFTNEAEKRKLFLTRYTWVKTTNRKKFPKRILMRFEFFKKPVEDDDLLVIQNEGRYSDEYSSLTKDFYLRF